MNKILITAGVSLFTTACSQKESEKPNILFVLMDDMGYGHFAPNNDTLQTSMMDPYFVSLAKSPLPYSDIMVRHHPNDMIEPYSAEDALEISRIAMPTLSMLAGKGVRFTSSYASNSLCAPSRMGIATGMHQSRMGIYENNDCEMRGITPGTHLAEKLHDLGYATAHIGKWHIGKRNDQMVTDALRRNGITENLSYGELLGTYPAVYKELTDSGYYGSVIDAHNPLQNGFDYYFGYNNWASQFYNSTLVWENYQHAGVQSNYNTDVFTDTALSFINKQIQLEKPFYVQLNYHAVHDSLKPKAPDKYFSQFTSDSYDLNNFYAHIYGVDSNIKRIIDYLESQNVLNNTLIVFTSDNGAESGGPSVLPGNAPFPGHKGTYFQGGMRVPLIFYWPEKIKSSFVCDQMVSSMDILPTLIDAAGGVLPDSLDGKSLYPVLTQESPENVHDYLFWAGLHSGYWGYLGNKSLKKDIYDAPFAWAIAKDDYLLRYTGTIIPDLYSDFPGGREPVYELYNIKQDPFESLNLIEQLPEKAADLKSIYSSRAKNLPPPVIWNLTKWKEIIPE